MQALVQVQVQVQAQVLVQAQRVLVLVQRVLLQVVLRRRALALVRLQQGLPLQVS
ncbi:MAG TPA: hypothetical protein PLG98_11530 [Smithella sp.]|nr:hypothetical protein [Smithella sp.]HPH55524.1 hypothetical protein [Smithella sp.]